MPDLTPEILTSTRIHPTTPTKPSTTPLSIVDAVVLTYAPASVLWIFSAPAASLDIFPLLSTSLAETLTLYPQWAGTIILNEYPAEGNSSVEHTRRFRRCHLAYGHEADPGVALEHARVPCRIDELLPSADTGCEHWDLTNLDLVKAFTPQGPVPGVGLSVPPGAAGVQIRVTEFACGGYALGIKAAHCLADATSLIDFAAAWGQITRALREQKGVPEIERVFDPALLDAGASGDVDAAGPEPGLLDKAERLPLPRYDWWEHEPGNPAWMDANPQVVIPPNIPAEESSTRRRGQRLPWEEWQTSQPVSHTILRLSATELDRINEMGAFPRHTSDPPGASPAENQASLTASRHDRMMAFIWQLIALARQLEDPDAQDKIFLDGTLGLRPRLGLPLAFVGSPVFLTAMAASYSEVTGSQLDADPADSAVQPRDADACNHTFPDEAAVGKTAKAIREYTAVFDREALGAWLHEMAFELAPQRIWNGFLGRRNVMAASWIRAGIWFVDFGLGENEARESSTNARESSSPLWAGPMMPSLDGLVTVVESRPLGQSSGRGWWHAGVDVDVNLHPRVMGRVLSLLQSWRSRQR